MRNEIGFVIYTCFLTSSFGCSIIVILCCQCRHLGDNAELVIIKNAGHAINVEKPKELYKHMKSFLIDPLPPVKQGNYSNDRKTD